MDENVRRESELERQLAIIFRGAVLIFGVVAGAYFLHFADWKQGLSQDPRDWAEFREYLGGTLGGIFGLFAFLGLLLTLVQQRAVSDRSVKATLDAVSKAHSIETESRRSSILAIAEAAYEHASRISDAIARRNFECIKAGAKGPHGMNAAIQMR